MRSSHSFGSAPKAMPAPSNSDNAAKRAPLRWLTPDPRGRRVARITAHRRLLRPARFRDSSSRMAGDLGWVGGHETEQRHAARQRTGIFAVRHHVVREPRRRHDAGRRTRRRRDVALGLAIRGTRFGGRSGAERHGGAGGVGREHDGFGHRVGWRAVSANRPGCEARKWTSRRRRRQCWRRPPVARSATSVRRKLP